MTDIQRRIRSFVIRPGRMTEGQRRAFDLGMPRFGLSLDDGTLDAESAFGRAGPLVMEIGFGMGQSLVDMAAAQPDTNFIGIEVHRPGVGRLLHSMEEQGVENIRVYCEDAVSVLESCLPDASLDGVQIFFPDPWHKKRHHKRRLIQPEFVQLLCRKLRAGAVLHLATDWENYAEQMMEVLSAEAALENMASPGEFAPRPDYRPLTKFEKRGQRLGHGVWDLLFRRL